MVSHRACFFFSKPRRGSLEHVGALNWRIFRLAPFLVPQEHGRSAAKKQAQRAMEHLRGRTPQTPTRSTAESDAWKDRLSALEQNCHLSKTPRKTPRKALGSRTEDPRRDSGAPLEDFTFSCTSAD